MRRGMLLIGTIGMVAMMAAPASAAMRSAQHGKARMLAKSVVHRQVLVGSRFSVLPPDSHPGALSTTRMSGFPTAGRSFMLLSSGNSLFAPRRNISESTSFSTAGLWIRGTRDLTIMRVGLRVPRGRNCLTFDFKFLSEEFPEFVDSEFNDGFLAELDDSDWYSDGNENPGIHNHPNNFAVDSEGRPVHVNNYGGTNRVSRAYARGTTYDGSTRILRASTPITPGFHRVWFSIFDQGDRGYDSTVFIDNLRLRRTATCTRGVELR